MWFKTEATSLLLAKLLLAKIENQIYFHALLGTYINVVSTVDDIEGAGVKVEQLGQRRDVTRAAVVLYQVDVSVRRATTAAAAAPATRTWLLH